MDAKETLEALNRISRNLENKNLNDKLVLATECVAGGTKYKDNALELYHEIEEKYGLCVDIVEKVDVKDVSKEMSKLSSGNYNISLKEGKDEIGILSKEFNNMSKELERRNKELLELIDSKQLFIDNLSHEMNTPLTSILGYSTLLESARLDDEQKMKYLHYIQDETKRINEMYKKLLVISYKENNNIDKVMINIDNLIYEVLEELNSKINSNNIKVIIDNNVDYINKFFFNNSPF